MDLMTFINENYVAIILVLVIILMTIIGYIADKKYSNGNKEKPKKMEKKEEVIEDTLDTSKDMNTNLLDSFEMPNDIEPEVDSISDAEGLSFDVPPVEPVQETDYSFDNTEQNYDVASVEPVSYDAAQAEESTDATNNETENPVEANNEVVDIDWENPVEEVKEEPIESNQEVEEEKSEWETIDGVVDDEQSEDINSISFDTSVEEDFKLPNIDTLNEELKDVDNEDDVWKF